MVTAVSSRGSVRANIRSARIIFSSHGDVGRDIDGVRVLDDEGLDVRIGRDDDRSGDGLDGSVDDIVDDIVVLDALGG